MTCRFNFANSCQGSPLLNSQPNSQFPDLYHDQSHHGYGFTRPAGEQLQRIALSPNDNLINHVHTIHSVLSWYNPHLCQDAGADVEKRSISSQEISVDLWLHVFKHSSSTDCLNISLACKDLLSLSKLDFCIAHWLWAHAFIQLPTYDPSQIIRYIDRNDACNLSLALAVCDIAEQYFAEKDVVRDTSKFCEPLGVCHELTQWLVACLTQYDAAIDKLIWILHQEQLFIRERDIESGKARAKAAASRVDYLLPPPEVQTFTQGLFSMTEDHFDEEFAVSFCEAIGNPFCPDKHREFLIGCMGVVAMNVRKVPADAADTQHVGEWVRISGPYPQEEYERRMSELQAACRVRLAALPKAAIKAGIILRTALYTAAATGNAAAMRELLSMEVTVSHDGPAVLQQPPAALNNLPAVVERRSAADVPTTHPVLVSAGITHRLLINKVHECTDEAAAAQTLEVCINMLPEITGNTRLFKEFGSVWLQEGKVRLARIARRYGFVIGRRHAERYIRDMDLAHAFVQAVFCSGCTCHVDSSYPGAHGFLSVSANHGNAEKEADQSGTSLLWDDNAALPGVATQASLLKLCRSCPAFNSDLMGVYAETTNFKTGVQRMVFAAQHMPHAQRIFRAHLASPGYVHDMKYDDLCMVLEVVARHPDAFTASDACVGFWRSLSDRLINGRSLALLQFMRSRIMSAGLTVTDYFDLPKCFRIAVKSGLVHIAVLLYESMPSDMRHASDVLEVLPNLLPSIHGAVSEALAAFASTGMTASTQGVLVLALVRAAYDADMEAVETLMSSGADVSSFDYAPVRVAAAGGHGCVIQYWSHKGLVSGDAWCAALYAATTCSQNKVVDQLFDAPPGSMPYSTMATGIMDAVDWAAAMSDINALSALLNRWMARGDAAHQHAGQTPGNAQQPALQIAKKLGELYRDAKDDDDDEVWLWAQALLTSPDVQGPNAAAFAQVWATLGQDAD